MGMLNLSETAGRYMAKPCDTPASLGQKSKQLKDPSVLANWFNPLSYVVNNEASFLRGGTEQLMKIKQIEQNAGVKICPPTPHM